MEMKVNFHYFLQENRGNSKFIVELEPKIVKYAT